MPQSIEWYRELIWTELSAADLLASVTQCNLPLRISFSSLSEKVLLSIISDKRVFTAALTEVEVIVILPKVQKTVSL